ncbi:glycosyltransferase family 8 protein [Megamonas funiformis]|uniref:glycosyltransferase family 8 protein n=1 Tax=Megamonas funiformis TaxID=437897 RepID=UPI003A8EB965
MNLVEKKYIYGKKDIEKNYFHIVFGIDDDFVRPLGVLMTSIIENNKNENIEFHIISKYISKENRRIIKQFAIENDININIYIIDETIFNDLPTTSYITKAMYNRFLIPLILKDVTDRVLYLDADIVCLNSIENLKKINIDNKIIAVIEESNDYVVKKRVKDLSLTSKKYFNSGVLYININNWINRDINNKLINYAKSVKDLIFPDQDILNVILEKDCLYIDQKYNYTFDVRYKSNRYIYNLPQNIVFLHYVGKFKPWQKWCMHPAKKFFEKYANISLWKNVPLDEPKTYKQMKYMGKSYAIYNKKLESIYWYLKYAVYKIKAKL